MSEFSSDEMKAAAGVLERMGVSGKWVNGVSVAAIVLAYLGQAISYACLSYPEDPKLRAAAAVYTGWRQLPTLAPTEAAAPPPSLAETLAVPDLPNDAAALIRACTLPTDEQLVQVVDHLKEMA